MLKKIVFPLILAAVSLSGVSHASAETLQPRVLNGDLTTKWNGYTVSLHSKDSYISAQGKNEENPLYKSHYCTGTLIAPLTIITSAWCVVNTENHKFLEKLNPNNIFVGASNDLNDTTPTYAIEDIWVHPNYNPKFYRNDVALIKLTSEVEGSSPVSIGSVSGPRGGAIYGWGATEPNWERQGYGFSENMQIGEVEILSEKVCKGQENAFIKNERLYPNATKEVRKNIDKFHCATGVTDKEVDINKKSNFIDACYTDEGTGLIDKESNTVVGVAIFDLGCGGASPRLYTKITPYISLFPSHMLTPTHH